MKYTRKQAVRLAKKMLKNDLHFQQKYVDKKAQALSDECDGIEIKALVASVLKDALDIHMFPRNERRKFNKLVKNFNCF